NLNPTQPNQKTKPTQPNTRPTSSLLCLSAVSQMVIEEVSAIQEDLELERMCRESAEALASQLNRQNRSLKRKSMMLLSHLSPETLTAIDLEDEDGDGDEEAACLSPQCHATVSACWTDVDVFAVSQLAVEEYEALQHSLDLERDLRTEAEIFARTMVVEQKKLQRQSQILMQSSSPSQALQDAMGQVAQLTQQLETQRLEHQNQVCTPTCPGRSDPSLSRRRRPGQSRGLDSTMEELQKKLQAATNPPPAPAPAPAPPPPPPPPAPAAPTNPLRWDSLAVSGPEWGSSGRSAEADVRQQAVDEMMQRIKRGVQLRPVGRAAGGPRRQVTQTADRRHRLLRCSGRTRP
uniref:Shootin-1 n=1 Tax=Salarias fasciatus TaxID=181472 RepID=A0A672HZS9_SALFA